MHLGRLCAPFGPPIHIQIFRGSNAAVRPGTRAPPRPSCLANPIMGVCAFPPPQGQLYGVVAMASHGAAMMAQAHLHGHILGAKVLDVRMRPHLGAAA